MPGRDMRVSDWESTASILAACFTVLHEAKGGFKLPEIDGGVLVDVPRPKRVLVDDIRSSQTLSDSHSNTPTAVRRLTERLRERTVHTLLDSELAMVWPQI